MLDLLGRLHPALVHLPIGILLLGVCFELLSGKNRFAALRPALPTIIFWGMVSAVLSCITGLVLESGGDYEEDLVEPHEWAGLALAAASIVLYILYRRRARTAVIRLFALIILAMVFLTGHLGGTITHGEGFLSIDGEAEVAAPVPMKPIPDIQQAAVYADIVQPVLQARCYSCHGTKKQKGKLRLDSQQFMLKGGEDGKAIVPGDAEHSELVSRILLPPNDDDHMPPPRKTQLTNEQVNIIKWWVSTGADFNKKVGELPQPEQIKPVLLALQSGTTIAKEEVEIVPAAKVPAADNAVLQKLNAAGISVLPVARESNYLSANFINASKLEDSVMQLLASLQKQLISLRMDGIAVQKNDADKLARLSALRKLQISNSALSDDGLKSIANLKDLRSLNLVGTSVTKAGLSQLAQLKTLKYLYLYKSGVSAQDSVELKKIFPGTRFDFGNYSLPLLAGDTSEIKF